MDIVERCRNWGNTPEVDAKALLNDAASTIEELRKHVLPTVCVGDGRKGSGCGTIEPCPSGVCPTCNGMVLSEQGARIASAIEELHTLKSKAEELVRSLTASRETRDEWKTRAEEAEAKLEGMNALVEASEKRAGEAESKLDVVLVKLENLGWPCRLIELPDEYARLVKELEAEKKRSNKAEGELSAMGPRLEAAWERIRRLEKRVRELLAEINPFKQPPPGLFEFKHEYPDELPKPPRNSRIKKKMAPKK